MAVGRHGHRQAVASAKPSCSYNGMLSGRGRRQHLPQPQIMNVGIHRSWRLQICCTEETTATVRYVTRLTFAGSRHAGRAEEIMSANHSERQWSDHELIGCVARCMVVGQTVVGQDRSRQRRRGEKFLPKQPEQHEFGAVCNYREQCGP